VRPLILRVSRYKWVAPFLYGFFIGVAITAVYYIILMKSVKAESEHRFLGMRWQNEEILDLRLTLETCYDTLKKHGVQFGGD